MESPSATWRIPRVEERQANHTHFRGSELGAADEFSQPSLK
jgi:hypothetical protein